MKLRMANWRLLWAAARGNAKASRSAIASGADLGARVPISRSTALHLAVRRGSLAVVRVLIEAGADIDAEDRWGMKPLHIVGQYGYVRTTYLLVEHGADVSAVDKRGRTPLDWATGCGCDDVAALLVGVNLGMEWLRHLAMDEQ